MNSSEFLKSLSSEQAAAMNALLVEQRDAINTMRDAGMAEMVAIHTAEVATKDADILAATDKSSRLDDIVAAISDNSLDDGGTLDAIKGVVAASQLTDVQIKILEITKQRDELNAQLAELGNLKE